MRPPARRWRATARLRAHLALVLATVMAATLLTASGFREEFDDGTSPLPDSERPVAGEAAAVADAPPARRPAPPTPVAAWPEAETAVVDLAGHGTAGAPEPVAGLPVALAADAPGLTAEVTLLDAEAGRAVGAAGPVVVIRPEESTASGAPERADAPEPADAPAADPPAGETPAGETPAEEAPTAEVELDYSDFAGAFGGGFGARLGLAELPACALETPGDAACRTPAPVDFTNDTENGTLTADGITLTAGTATVLAAVSEEGSERGDFAATELSAASTWGADLNSGDFTWSYDMPAPAVPGGLLPTLGLSYSAGGVDGRTSSTNNQGSWAGDGFQMWPGYIERAYTSCGYDEVQNEHDQNVGDLCWEYDNAFISLNGMSGELVPDGANTWRLRQDNGTRIERLTGSARANGDNNNEYWRVTDTAGTQYYFGYHRLPGWTEGDETTDSTWTVPVYGNNSGEPCHASATEDAWCQQGWRWNLDYVVDVRGNAMAYYYDRERNSYGRFLEAEDDTRYTRGGTLDRIEYGLNEDDVAGGVPLARVRFTNEDRCLPGDGADCSDIEEDPYHWYDTPWDLNCDAGEECDAGRFSPTFWTTKRLTGVTTEVRVGSAYQKVDSWELTHHWGTADADYQLLLDGIRHTGHTGDEPISLPWTRLDYTQLANRLDETGDGYAPFVKARLSQVVDELGGQINAGFSAPACTAGDLPRPESNTTRCFPQYLAGGPEHDPDLQWFNKYVVTDVTVTDRTGGSPNQVTRYRYLGDAAWHYDDDNGLVPEEEKTWSQWRGYGHVRVLEGGQDSSISQEDTYFLRGMHGDRREEDGGTKSVSVALGAGEGDPITDHAAHAGFPYKTVIFDGTDGSPVSRTVSRPWRQETARDERDWGTIAAHFTGTSRQTSWSSLSEGSAERWRVTEQRTAFNPDTGDVIRVDDLGDTSVAGDEKCTRITYAAVDDRNIRGLIAHEEQVAVGCSATPDRATDVLGATRFAYDGRDYGAAPRYGAATATAVLKEHDGTTGTYLESGATFDRYGRQLSETDLTADLTVPGDGTGAARVQRTPRDDGRTATTSYSPATGFATTIRTTSPPATPGDPASALTETTVNDIPRGQPQRTIDPNGATTTYAYDALGRNTAVWMPDRRTSATPSYAFDYRIVENEPVAISSSVIGNRGRQDTSWTIYDGLMRPRQTQTPGPDGGRLLTDTFYDERGLTTKTFAAYYAEGAPGHALFLPAEESAVETQTRHRFDALGRETETRLMAGDGDGGRELSVTRTHYDGDRVTTVPPAGGTATTGLMDAHGRLTELREHHSPSADAPFDTTRYTYTPRGELASVTDPAGNEWTYRYDQLGRMVSTTDPDTGTTTHVFDDRAQTTSTTNGRGVTLAAAYDGLGRVTEMREGGPDGPLRAEWLHDTLPGAKGLTAKAIRWENGEAYVSETLAVDVLNRPLRTAITIPESEGALAGTYTSTARYEASGAVGSVGLPAAGGLPADTVSFAYEDGTLRPLTVSTFSGLSSDATYSLTGKPLRYVFSADDGPEVTATHTYEHGTRRLLTSRVERQDQLGVDRHETFRYDPAGNVLAVADVSRTGTDVQCFTYDHLRRLTEAWTQAVTECAASGSAASVGGPEPYHHEYTYDLVGNRLTETRHEQDTTRAYTYAEDQPHAVTSVTEEAPGVTSLEQYGYDAAGNTVSRQLDGNTQTLTWNAEGRVAEVENADGTGAEYLYGADGSRLIARTAAGTTLYLGHTELTVPEGADTAEATRYYDLGGGHQAVVTEDGTTSFNLADHHGTGNLSVNAATQAITQRRTLPFGGPRDSEADTAWPGSRGFVGGIDDTGTTGLVSLGAREYDPALGRFISADPLMDLTDPQQINGYAYAHNNPLTYSDPTGLYSKKLGRGGKKKSPGKAIGRPSTPKAPAWTPSWYGSTGGNAWQRGWNAFRDTAWESIAPAAQAAHRDHILLNQCLRSGASGCWGDAAMRAGEFAVTSWWDMNALNPQAWVNTATGTWDHVTGIYDDIKAGRYAEATGTVLFDVVIGLATRKLPVSIKPRGDTPSPSGNRGDRTPESSGGGGGSSGGGGGGGGSSGGGGGPRGGGGGGSSGGGGGGGGGNVGGGGGGAHSPTGSAGNSCHSFLPGTEVLLADGTTKPIEEVETGDLVLATDPETGETVAKTAVAAITTEYDKDFTELTIDAEDGPSRIIATDTHPFWVPALDDWIPAGELHTGQWLRTSSGTHVQITAVTRFTEQQRTHDLTVEDIHSYYVLAGTTPLLVHNCGEAIVHLDRPQAHALITVTDGTDTLRTEQFGGVNLPTNGVSEFDPATLSPVILNVHVSLPNPGGALAFIEVAMAKTARGKWPAYDLETQSCITYCAQVLNAGGVPGIPTDSMYNTTAWFIRHHGRHAPGGRRRGRR
ncbi:RHS repeat-associated core domain-containing protein [Streptomyces marincola]|uniref:RHS repeat-associated core domain-containing protein n=1 Tax=Streptomyces marincola TaxID=2878388 RepID=UPI001CF4EDFE|nr:RHS repeat-associated core domain-containing protein [Streptomyces marincola]UCM86590.1 sugar-binding protein [Streptomyces marincola]